MSMSYGSVEKSADKAEASLQEAQSRQQSLLRQLVEVQMEVQRHEREVEFARKRAEEQFWCLERSLEERGEQNLFAQVREATEWERELYGITALPTAQVEAEASSSQGS